MLLSMQSAAWAPTPSVDDLMAIAFPYPSYNTSNNTHGHLE